MMELGCEDLTKLEFALKLADVHSQKDEQRPYEKMCTVYFPDSLTFCPLAACTSGKIVPSLADVTNVCYCFRFNRTTSGDRPMHWTSHYDAGQG